MHLCWQTVVALQAASNSIYQVLEYRYVSKVLEKRAPFREEHLSAVKSQVEVALRVPQMLHSINANDSMSSGDRDLHFNILWQSPIILAHLLQNFLKLSCLHSHCICHKTGHEGVTQRLLLPNPTCG